jgi:hypothetical protein
MLRKLINWFNDLTADYLTWKWENDYIMTRRECDVIVMPIQPGAHTRRAMPRKRNRNR